MAKINSPYADIPAHSHWRNAVSGVDPLKIPQWYRKKFDIGRHAIATAGSCFAQHIGRGLAQSGFNYLDAEKAPSFLSADSRQEFGYDLYSARYGNVYTARQLRQLIERAFGLFSPAEEYWEKDDGLVDAFRPTIEPYPFGSLKELRESRDFHFECVRSLIQKTGIFIFTLGLTEAWVSRKDGAVFPVAPGISGGEFSEEKYEFMNFGFREVLDDLFSFMKLAVQHKPGMRFILTVSPVPLMATATGKNVVVATTYSKSVLRAVAGHLSEKRSSVDYFPSFEIINSHVMSSRFYDSDMRTIKSSGVDHVMQQFFSEHIPPEKKKGRVEVKSSLRDVTCDEELISAFGK